MKRLTTATAISTLALAAAGTVAQAASVEVQWQNPEEYSDLQPTNEGKQNFQDRILASLEEQFRHAAKALPEGQTLHVTVTDMDLAGEIEYFHPNYPFGLRVIRRVDAPGMEVSYELRNENDVVIASGDSDVRDLGFAFSKMTRVAADRYPLGYEKQMIEDWVRETFIDNRKASES